MRRGVKEMTKDGRGRSKKGEVVEPVKPHWGVDELLMKAEELVETYQPELAQKFYERGLEVNPNHTGLLDSYAQFLLDKDEFNMAKQLLEKSIQLSPNENWIKYMNLGQILNGKEALQCYNKGIELMIQYRARLQSGEIPNEESELQDITKEIVSALCSQAELFMTDECYEESAESECEKLINKALEIDPSNAETLQTLANLRLCQQKDDQALQLLNQSYSLWKDADDLPSMELCHNTAKMFLELEQDKTAAEIWESLLDLDDNIAEIHYHLGLAYRYISTESSKECLSRAKELLLQCTDPQLLKQVEDMLNQVQTENYQNDEENEEGEEDEEEGGGDDDNMDVK